MKITAIHCGDEWSDSSASYLILPDGMDYATERAAHEKWYLEEYIPAFRSGKAVNYIDIVAWLLERGAVEPTDDQLEIVSS